MRLVVVRMCALLRGVVGRLGPAGARQLIGAVCSHGAMADAPAPTYLLRRCELADGACTTVYAVRHAGAAVRPRVQVFAQPRRLDHWCWRSGAREAIVGGFYLRDPFRPLGDVHVEGRAVRGTAFPDA